MDRTTWLEDRRAAVVAQYDDEAATYEDDSYPVEEQHRFVDRLLATCPPGGVVLDVPCGTGPYFAQVAASGRRVVGADQSAGMLDAARDRGIADALHQVGLQELAFGHEFDAVMTIDAMENVFPEDWPLVLANLHRAARPGAYLYMTIEEVDDALIDAAFAELQVRGIPAVRGEVVEGDTAGYHYYPGRERVRGWLEADGLAIVEEATTEYDDWAYWHLLLRGG
jgi:ubiquinone/menaquinone biosynthesis C-methylase UbiE